MEKITVTAMMLDEKDIIVNEEEDLYDIINRKLVTNSKLINRVIERRAIYEQTI